MPFVGGLEKSVGEGITLYFCYYVPGTQIISAQATEFYRLWLTCLCYRKTAIAAVIIAFSPSHMRVDKERLD